MEEKYKSDLAEIRDMMHRSSRFISLDGWSGIAVGIIALVGAYLAYHQVYATLPEFSYAPMDLSASQLGLLIYLAGGTLILALAAAIFFTIRESRKKVQGIWDAQSKRLVINLAIPLVTGGLLCLILLFNGFLAFLAPITLLFHGMALVNASQYTYKQVRILGLAMIILGLFGMLYLNLGLLFWTVGFGVLHILYGLVMQWKK